MSEKKYIKGLIYANGFNIKSFAKILGLNSTTLSKKIKKVGNREFTQSEIKRLIEILEIPDNEIKKYFFD